MRAYLSALVIPFVVTACSSNTTSSSAMDKPLPPMFMDNFTDSLTDVIYELGSVYEECPMSRDDSIPRHAKHVALESSFSWCSNRKESLRLQDELVHLCFSEKGALSGDWCYEIKTGAPLYRFSHKPAYSTLPQSDEEPIQWWTEVTAPRVGQKYNFDWLTFARSQGFLTQEQLAYSDIFKAKLKKLQAEQQFDEKLVSLREQINTHFANRKALRGQYGVLACKKDDTYFTLEGEIVGRVLATFEHTLQVQYVEYRGFSGVPAQFKEGEVVIEDYANWKPCNS